MKLKALDQIHISSVKRDALAAGEEFEVSDAYGAELMKAHPMKFRRLDEEPDIKVEEPASDGGEKAEDPPANKADGRRKTKSAGE